MKKGIESAMSRIKDYLNTKRTLEVRLEADRLTLMLICLAVSAFYARKKVLDQKRSKYAENDAEYVSE